MLVSGWVIVVALFPQLATAKVRTFATYQKCNLHFFYRNLKNLNRADLVDFDCCASNQIVARCDWRFVSIVSSFKLYRIILGDTDSRPGKSDSQGEIR